jgi:hypothetical protein
MKNSNRQIDDFYPTPPEATKALLDRQEFERDIWEPACGNGAISNVLAQRGHNVISTDLNDFGFGKTNIDFLMEQKALASNVITNPPFKLANEFVHKCIELKIDKFAFLLRLAFLEGQSRKSEIYDVFPPSHILVFSKRLTMWRGDEEKPEKSTGTTAYAWFIWSKIMNEGMLLHRHTRVGWI